MLPSLKPQKSRSLKNKLQSLNTSNLGTIDALLIRVISLLFMISLLTGRVDNNILSRILKVKVAMSIDNKWRTQQSSITISINTKTKAKTIWIINQWANCAMTCLNLLMLVSLLMRRTETWSLRQRWVHRNLNTRLTVPKKVLIKLRDESRGKQEKSNVNIKDRINLTSVSNVKRLCNMLTSVRQ